MNIKIVDINDNEIPVLRIEEYGNDVTVMISAPVWHDMEKDSPPDSDNLVIKKVKGKVWWYLLPHVPERSE
jgi:hypothetical protein